MNDTETNNMASTKDRIKTLATLASGQTARIMGIEAPRPLKRRLMDMGLTHGVTVKVLKVAPLGDPMEIALRGYHLCLRRDEAAKVAIEGVDVAQEKNRR
ncbi:MAG: FeoA family protein [Sphaerochaetaceae bacterium]|nr:FeoA family protein [Sphaerochaetaceae bacterium]